MSLLPFLIVSMAMTGVALALRSRAALATAVGIAGLIATLLAALAIQPGQGLVIGGAAIATTEYLRLFLVLLSTCGIGLALLGAAAGPRRDTAAVMLGTLATSGLALAVPDARIAILAVTAGGLLGVLVTLIPGSGRVGATVGIREIRAVIIAGSLAFTAAAWIQRPLDDVSVQPQVFGLAYLAFALAVAVRFGVIPFHFWAARLADAAPEVTLPVLQAWGPAAMAVVALAWIDGLVAPILPDVGAERAVLIGIGIATIVLATFAAWIQDDLEHVLGYSIVGDAGVIVLGLAALGTDAWTPVRVWIIAFVVARSAFAAWCAAVRATFWTGRLDDLRGWARHSPPLIVCLVLVMIASIGLPGFAAWNARAAIVQQLFGGPLAALLLLALLAPILYYVRLLLIGWRRPLGGSAAEDWRPRWPAFDVNRIRGSVESVGRVNRGASTAALALLLAALAVGTSAGLFGLTDAAAGVGPGFQEEGPGPAGP